MTSDVPYEPPQYMVRGYNCPHCGAFADQRWEESRFEFGGRLAQLDELKRALCNRCGKYTLWHHGMLIYPEDSGIPAPNGDLNDDIKADYAEAASIVVKSPRGAAALLRLCVQKLCVQLHQKGKDLNDDIAALVKSGLPAEIQQAFDIVRVIGNNAVHPGQMDLRDDSDTALRLFQLLNMVAQVLITQPKQVADLYASIPKTARDAIDQRDATSKPEDDDD